MPLIPLVRLLLGVISLIVLGAAAYLLITWGRGELVVVDDLSIRVRDDWRLWAGLGLLVPSFLGRWIVLPLLARPDTEPTRPVRGHGEMIAGFEGASLYVERHGTEGSGPVVILTHGWGLDSTIWQYARRDLAALSLVTWDLPGLGRSKHKGRLTLETLSENLKVLIESIGDRPVVLVGHSIGGMTIQTLARDHPELFSGKVSGVVLINTTWTNPLRTMLWSPVMLALRWPVLEPMMRLARWLQPLAWLGAWHGYISGSAHIANRLGFGRWVTHSQLEHNTLLATRNPPAVLAQGNLAMFRWDGEAGLPRLTVPTLVLAGDMDLVTKLEASEHIAAHVPSARLQAFEGCNHMGFLEQAESYNAAISRFVQGLAPAHEGALEAQRHGQTSAA